MAEERLVDPLEDLRKKIDALDDALVRLLNARAACALEIGRFKKEIGLAIYQPSREAEVLGHVQSINPGPLDDGAVRLEGARGIYLERGRISPAMLEASIDLARERFPIPQRVKLPKPSRLLFVEPLEAALGRQPR